MCLFIETIKINNGKRLNLKGHQERLDRTQSAHFEEFTSIQLRKIIHPPRQFSSGIVKCRVIYGRKLHDITYEHYVFKNPRTFRMIESKDIEYAFKSENRKKLQHLFQQKKDCDDIIIVKNNLITDSYYANIALLQDGKWYTPRKPLLPGTFRNKLLKIGNITLRDISKDSILDYEKLKIYNAITEWSMHTPVSISCIYE